MIVALSTRFSFQIPFDYGLLQLKNYQVEIEEMKNMNRQEYVAHLRRYQYVATRFALHISVYSLINWLLVFRKSSGFSRGASIYRGVTRCVHKTRSMLDFFLLVLFARLSF